MGLAGFQERPVQDDDPLVCSCGITIGTRLLEKSDVGLKVVLTSHEEEHKRRLAHQARHRGPVSDCSECTRAQG